MRQKIGLLGQLAAAAVWNTLSYYVWHYLQHSVFVAPCTTYVLSYHGWHYLLYYMWHYLCVVCSWKYLEYAVWHYLCVCGTTYNISSKSHR